MGRGPRHRTAARTVVAERHAPHPSRAMTRSLCCLMAIVVKRQLLCLRGQETPCRAVPVKPMGSGAQSSSGGSGAAGPPESATASASSTLSTMGTVMLTPVRSMIRRTAGVGEITYTPPGISRTSW